MRYLLALVALMLSLVPFEARTAANPLEHVRLTTPQDKVARETAPRAIWVDGNRLGKTFKGAWEVHHRARGTHPFKKTHRPPVQILVGSLSWEQMQPLMKTLWELAPKGELGPKCGYDPGRGITGKPPRLVYTSGPGAGSIIQFATYKQGAARVAGGGYHFVLLDEPPTEEMWGEVQPRVLRTRGDILAVFTPTPDMPPVKYLRELVEKGEVRYHNYGLKEANCWIPGAPRPFLTQEEIDEYAASLLAIEREMRINGAWEPLVEGRYLLNFDTPNVRGDIPPPGGAWTVVGVDHGSSPGKQAAMLFCAEGPRTPRPRAWWWDEVRGDGYTTPEQDAHAILDMLGRNGLTYDDVDEWVGDRPTGQNRYMVNKSNIDLKRELARALKRDVSKLKFIHTPRKWDGSVWHGLRGMNGIFGRTVKVERRGRVQEIPAALVHPRCEEFIKFCRTWRGDSRDPLKDMGDAGRYPFERAIKEISTIARRAHF